MSKAKNIMQVHKDIQKKKHDDLVKRGGEFMDEYRTLCRKHHIDLCAELELHRDGIRPVLRARELEEPKMKPWSEAKRENLEMRAACQHEVIAEPGSDPAACEMLKCTKCGLHRRNWADSTPYADSATEEQRLVGSGITDAYRADQERQIKGLIEAEAEEAAEKEE